ncbi:sterol desaturase family protein [Salinispira pacifica]|uniref:Putative sterol desaturase n=1 Tax=Salinispira pacifica TaxID=1307761 RepID=V5WIM0_9SPIO|nr:sterol desaturase family protein [Salinispira pacifica]AHC15677.1 putative sterol desaturase [Salinispira pacifica]
MFAALALLELALPDREAVDGRKQRWPGNLLIILMGNLLLRLIGPLLPYSAALFIEGRSWGFVSLGFMPFWVKVVISVLILDAWIYLQHVLFHRVKFLRPFHRMHHSDTHIDFTTGFRMHPVEILLSALYKSFLVIALGIPAFGVFLFEVILNAASMFSHGNFRISPGFEKQLRKVIITPQMHRTHHSLHADERNSNYGFFLSVWDRIFSTYTHRPRDGQRWMKVGMPGLLTSRVNRIDRMVIEPFLKYPRTEEGDGNFTRPDHVSREDGSNV